MEVLGIVVGVLLIVAAVVITAVVLLQSSKNARQSGVVSGGAEALLGKSKGKEIDRKLNKLTMVVAIVFVALVLVMYIVQPDKAKADYGDVDAAISNAQTTAAETTTSAATTTAAGTTTAGDAGSSEAPATTEAPVTTEAE